MPEVEVRGTCLPYDQPTERISGILWIAFAKGCLDESLRDDDYRILYAHNGANILGRKSNDTTEAWNQGNDLHFRANIGDTERDALVNMIDYRIGRRDLKGMSVGVTWSFEDEVIRERADGAILIYVMKARLREYSIVGNPQYEDTSIENAIGDIVPLETDFEIINAQIALMEAQGE